MIDSQVEYRSIIMRCDQIDKSAYLEPALNVEFVCYQKGMEAVWADIQKNAGEFAETSASEVTAYFMVRYGSRQSELSKRCIFLKEKSTGRYIGTCMAWFEQKGTKEVPVLHWLAVDDLYAGKGYARMLITRVLILFEQLGMELPIYLHTQPWSYRAVKLYNDFGFCIAQTDTYGTAVNEYEEAMPVLKKYMTKEAYTKLEKTKI